MWIRPVQLLRVQLFLVLCCLTCPAFANNPFAVFDTDYGVGGTAGNYTIEVNGQGFDRTVTAKMTNSTFFELSASAYYRINEDTLYATFDMTEVDPGQYHVIIEKPKTSEKYAVYNGLQVILGTNPSVSVERIGLPPTFVRDGSPVAFQIRWENRGLNDCVSPIIDITANEPIVDPLAVVDSNEGASVFAIYGYAPADEPPGILRPGSSVTKDFCVLPVVGVDGPRDLFVNVSLRYPDPDAYFDPNDLIGALHSTIPSDVDSSQTIEDLNARIMSQVGQNSGEYLRFISEYACRLAHTELTVRELEQAALMSRFAQVAAEQGRAIVGQVRAGDFTQSLGGLLISITDANGYRINTHSLFDGTFIYPWLKEGSYQVTDESMILPQTVNTSEQLAIPVILDIVACQEIIGFVREDITEVPLPNVTVFFKSSESAYTASTVSRDSGMYLLSWDGSSGTLGAFNGLHVPFRETFDPCDTNIFLDPGIVLEGDIPIEARVADVNVCAVRKDAEMITGTDFIVGDIVSPYRYVISGVDGSSNWRVIFFNQDGTLAEIGSRKSTRQLMQLRSHSPKDSSQETDWWLVKKWRDYGIVYGEVKIFMAAGTLLDSECLEITEDYFLYIQAWLDFFFGGFETAPSAGDPITPSFRQMSRGGGYGQRIQHLSQGQYRFGLTRTLGVISSAVSNNMDDRQLTCGEPFKKSFSLSELNIESVVKREHSPPLGADQVALDHIGCEEGRTCQIGGLWAYQAIAGACGRQGNSYANPEYSSRKTTVDRIFLEVPAGSTTGTLYVDLKVIVNDSFDFYPHVAGRDWPVISQVYLYEEMGWTQEQQHSITVPVHWKTSIQVKQTNTDCSPYDPGSIDHTDPDREDCPSGYTYNTETHRCVPNDCPAQFIDPGTGECLCDQLPQGNCPGSFFPNPLPEDEGCITCQSIEDPIKTVYQNYYMQLQIATDLIESGQAADIMEMYDKIEKERNDGLASILVVFECESCSQKLGMSFQEVELQAHEDVVRQLSGEN